MKANLNWSAPEYLIWFGCGFAAYYLRYGNQWQGNEVRLIYNVLFGTLNLIGWCLEWLVSVYPFTLVETLGALVIVGMIVFFAWLNDWFIGLASRRGY